MGFDDTFRWEALAPAAGPDFPLTDYYRERYQVLVRIQREHPELCHWSLQALAMTWGRYSGAFHDTHWREYAGRDIAFLGYILLMGKDEGMSPADLAQCQTAFQDWAGYQAAIIRGRHPEA